MTKSEAYMVNTLYIVCVILCFLCLTYRVNNNTTRHPINKPIPYYQYIIASGRGADVTNAIFSYVSERWWNGELNQTQIGSIVIQAFTSTWKEDTLDLIIAWWCYDAYNQKTNSPRKILCSLLPHKLYDWREFQKCVFSVIFIIIWWAYDIHIYICDSTFNPINPTCWLLEILVTQAKKRIVLSTF